MSLVFACSDETPTAVGTGKTRVQDAHTTQTMSGTATSAPSTPTPSRVPTRVDSQKAAAQALPEVDAEVCGDCHPSILEGFQATGMGNSLYRPKDRPRIENFSPAKATVIHPVTGVQYRAFIDAEGRYWQEESLPGTDYVRRVEAEYVIGSGNHTRSYLGTVDGRVVELPMTWYSVRKIWDMSPGYERENHHRFSRPVKAMCLFCHNDLTQESELKEAMFEEPLAEGISCVRCHGDARAHVAARMNGEAPARGDKDPHIFNPARSSPEKQLQVCQQCHLGGEMRVLLDGNTWDQYDPQTPLADYMSLYVYAQDGGSEFSITSHGHRLSMSACAQSSKDAMKCTTCHNPHRRDKATETSGGCLTCHQMADCGDEHRAQDASCSSCHMHRGGTSDIPHVTFTDHFIRKNPSADQETPRPDTLQIIDVLAPYRSHDNPEKARVREGIAHARMWRMDGKDKHRPEAIRILSEALKVYPQSADGWGELAMALKAEGRFPEALQAFNAALQAGDGTHRFMLDQAEILEAIGQLPQAEKLLDSAVQRSPEDRGLWGNLANVRFRLGKMDAAERAYVLSEKYGPSQALTASNRGYLELQRKDYDAAEYWFKQGLKRDGLNPMMYANLGTLALARGRPDDAQGYYQDALKRDDNFVVALWMLGRISMDRKQWMPARAYFEKLISAAPKDPRGYIELANSHVRAGDRMGAQRAVMRGQAALPGHPAILQMLMRLRSAAPDIRPPNFPQ